MEVLVPLALCLGAALLLVGYLWRRNIRTALREAAELMRDDGWGK